MAKKPEPVQQWPADKVERRKVADLVPYARNARTHSPEQVDQIAASIKEWGWTTAVLVDETGQIIAGHGRILAAQKLKIAEVPVMVANGWTEAQKRAYVLADNKLALNAGWDAELLKLELLDLDHENFDLGLIGFHDEELANIFAPVFTDEDVARAEETPEPPVNPVTVLGDVWILGNHRLICGDSGDNGVVSKLLGSVRPELLITSPPYNQKIDKFAESGMHKGGGWVKKVSALAYSDDMTEPDYQAWQSDLLRLWFSVLSDGSSVFYNHKVRYRDKTAITPMAWLPGPFNLRQEIIWSRPGSVTQNARMFLPCDERIYWMTKGKGFFFNDTTEIKTYSSIWKIGLETNKTHAVGFPVELPKRCLLACSRDGGHVLEPFSGSGTTIMAGELTGRSIHAIELSPAYVDVAIQRWQKFTGKKATLEATGQTFEEVSTARYEGGEWAKNTSGSYDVGIKEIKRKITNAEATS